MAPTAVAGKGLNQVVSPDIQPAGELSVSYLWQSSAIGNPRQVQMELGLSRWFEVAASRGMHPTEVVAASELGLVRRGPWLLSTGLLNWNLNRGGKVQPFLEVGYYTRRAQWMLGVQGVDHARVPIVGVCLPTSGRVALQVDYLGGDGNALTIGVNYAAGARLEVNPALYFLNGSGRAAGYVAITYTVPAWRR